MRRLVADVTVALLLAFGLTMHTAQAANFFSRNGGGAWATAGTWSATGCPGGGSNAAVPGAADLVTICSGDTVTMNGNPGAANTLTISGTANWTQARTTNVGAGGISVTGDIAGGSNGVLTSTGNLSVGSVTTSTTVTVTLQTTAGLSITGTGSLGRLAVNSTATSSGTLSVTTALTGTSTLTNTGTLNIGGTSTITGLAANTAANTVNYNGAGAQTIKATNYIDLDTSGGGGARTLPNGGTVGVAGVFTPGAAAFTTTGNTIVFNGAGAQTVPAINGSYTNLQTATGGTKTLGGSETVNTVLTIGASTTLDLGSQTLTLAGSGTPLVINGTFTASTSTVNYSSGAATTITAANYNNLNGTGGNRTLPNGGTVGIAGTFTPGAGTYTTTGNTVIFNGSGAQTIPAITGSYNNLQTATGATKTLGGAETVTGVLTVGASTTLDLSSQTLTLSGAGTPFVINGTFTASTSTVAYTNAGATNITAADYNNLNGTGGNRTLPNGGTVGVAGTFTPGAGTYTITGSTVDYNGNGAQTVTAFTYNNLTTSTGGTKTLGGTVTVNSVLTVDTSSDLNLAAQTLNLAGAGTPLVINGTFTPSTSTVNYTNAGATNITAANYNNLNLTGGSRVLPNGGTVGVAATFTPGAGAFTVTGSTVDFNGTGAQSVPAFNYDSLTISGARTTNSVTLPNGGTVGIAGTFSPTATFSTGNYVVTNNTINFNGTGAQTVAAFNYNNLTVSGARTTNNVSLAGAGTIGIAGAFSATATFTSGGYVVTGSTVNYNGVGAQTVIAFNYNNLTLSGARTTNSITLANGGTVGVAGTFSPTATFTTGNYVVTNNTVSFNGSGAQTIPAFTFNNLSTATGGTKTLGGAVTVNSVFTVGASSTIDLSSQTLTLAGSGTPLVVNGTFTPSTSTVNYTNAGATNITAANYNNLNGSGGNRTLPNGGTVGIAGSFTPGAGTYTVTGSTVDFNGSGAQTIPAFNYNNLTSSSTGARTLANVGTIGVAGAFTPGSNGYTITGSTVNFNGTGAQTVSAFNYNNLTISGAHTANSVTLASSGTIGVAAALSNTATFTTGGFINTGSTVDFNGVGAQTIIAFNYNNLTISAARATNSVTLANGGTIRVAGAFSTTATFTTGNYVITGNTVEYNGTAAQTLNAFNYQSMTVNNAAGLSLTSGNATVNGTFTLNSGNVSTAANVLIVAATGSVTRVGGHVIGNLRKTFTAVTDNGVARTFEVGDAAAYAPAQITFGTISVTGTLTVKATSGFHPDVANSGIDPTQSPTKQSVNRYWSATSSGITFNNYSATLNYVAGDLDAGLDLTTVGLAKADSCDGSQLNCTWTYPTSGTVTATSAQATGMTSFSDFHVGRKVDHFVFTVPTTGQSDVPFAVTITAVDKNGNTVTGFTGSATITCTGSCTITAGNSTGSFTNGAYSGNVSISGAYSGTMVATQVGNAGVTGTSGNINVIAASQFEVAETTYSDLQVKNSQANIWTRVAGIDLNNDYLNNAGALQLKIWALTAARDVATGFTGAVTVEVVDASGGGACNTLPVIGSSFTETFVGGDSGRHLLGSRTVANAYPSARFRVSYPTVSPTIVACSSDSFAIRPWRLAGAASSAAAVAATDGSRTTTGTTNTLNNKSTSVATVHNAGRPFTVTTTAWSFTGATTTGYNGSPSATLSTCAGGDACVAPSTLSLSGSAVSGVLSASATYNEVGAFSMTLEDANFAVVDASDGTTAAQRTLTSVAIDVGRFVPDHFEVGITTAPGFATSCTSGGFTYVGQAFNFSAAPVLTVTAKAYVAAGSPPTTTKYTGTLWRLNTASIAGYSALTGTLDLTPPATPSVSESNGATTLTFGDTSSTARFQRVNPIAEFDAEIGIAVSVSDQDGVNFESPVGTNANPFPVTQATAGNGVPFTSGKKMRFGRLRLQNTSAPQNVDIPIPTQTEYWTGSVFSTNTLDNCTSLSSASLGSHTGGITAANMGNSHVSLGGTFASGIGNVRLTKPSPAAASPGAVTLTVDLSSQTYLQGAWGGVSTYTANPSARATFGVFGAQPQNFIFQRENY